MSVKTMAEVLAEHEMENSPVIRGEGYTRCSCGYLSKGAYSRAAHNSHVTAALTAAGFGLVAAAKGEALEEAATDFEDNIGINEFDDLASRDGRRWTHIHDAWEYQGPYMDWLRARAAAVRGEG